MSSSAKKKAKLALLKLLSRRYIPEGVTAQLLKALGISYEGKAETREKVSISKFMNGCAGGFCISIDFDNRKDERIEVDKEATLEILSLCDEFNIPVTWAICGVTAVRERDAFDCILNSKVRHEIAVHTFDHVDFSNQNCTEELARSQILNTINLLPPGSGRTFIFPWNRTGHFEVLRELGFIAYRGRDRKLAYPSKANGLWNIHPLFYLDDKNYSCSNVLKALLDLAISREAIFHLWFHPWNLEAFGSVSRYVRDTIRPLFEYADSKRRSGELWVCTMGELANYCEARSNAKVNYNESKRSMDICIECKIEDVRFSSKQVLTLGVRMPKGVTKIKASSDGAPIGEESLKLRNLSRESRSLYLNLLFDAPRKKIRLDFYPELN
ncbi:MAG: polysaccharide deacetylase family protein [Candidatus Bathyarchaeia archaeon]